MSAQEHDVRYAYDDLGRLSAVSAVLFHGQTLSSPLLTRYTYDRAGRTDLVTLPNGLTTDHDYDPLGRLVSLSVTRDDPATDAAERTPVASFGYELLGDGRRREVTERRFTPAGALFSGTRVTYAYDGLGRLTEEDHLTTSAATGTALLAFRDGYTYDLAGNRLSKAHDANRDEDLLDPGDAVTAYDYDPQDDRLLTETRTPGGPPGGGTPTTTAYFHDAAGNTTRVESGGTATRYGYDLRGRQTETHLDGDNVPEATTTRDSRGGVVSEAVNGVTTTHLLDYHNLTGYSQVLEQRTGSTLTRSFVLGPTVLAQADAAGMTRLVRDGTGSVRGIADAAGLLTEGYAYDAFGVAQGFTPESARSVHLFHGERFSPALGGSDVRGERVYESGTGRWRTADRYTPGVGDLSDRNRYDFVGADPVNHTDPTGMFSLSQALVVVGLVGLGASMLAPGLLTLNYRFGRNASLALGLANTRQFVPVNPSQLEGMYHSVKIRNSRLSADDLFAAMSRFSQRNMYPAEATGDVTGVGGAVSFDMRQDKGYYINPLGHIRELGQGDFSVRVTRYDPGDRYFVVRTLGGHPLAGWRRWQVSELPNGDMLIETYSVEHSATGWDAFKMSMGGQNGMQRTWQNFLWDLVLESQGQKVDDFDTVLGGRSFKNDEARRRLPLVEGGGR